jgi:hypothetical protein
MIRDEAIAIIQRRLEVADDATVRALAEQLTATSEPAAGSDVLRPLTARELALIEQSREDFRQGRTMTLDEVRQSLDEAMARRRALRAVIRRA